MKIRLRVRHKVIAVILMIGALFFSGIIYLAYINYRSFVIYRNNRNLNNISGFISKRIQAEMLYIKKHLVIAGSNSQILWDAVEKANSAYTQVSENDAAARVSGIEALWDKGAWDKMEDELTGSLLGGFLKDLKQVFGAAVAEIAVLDMKGAVVAATGKTERYYYADEDWWQKVNKRWLGAVYLFGGDYYIYYNTAAFILVCPVVDVNGVVIGVSRAIIEKEKFLGSIFDIYLDDETLAGVITSQAENIFQSKPWQVFPSGFLKSTADFISRSTSPAGRPGKTRGLGEHIIGFAKIEGPVSDLIGDWYVYCLRDMRHTFLFLQVNILNSIFIWAILMALLFVISVVVSKRLVEPLTVLRTGCARIRKGGMDNITGINSGDEFEELARDFNDMVDELRKGTISIGYFNNIIQNMSDVLFVITPQGKLGLVNKRACELLGYEEKELLNSEAAEILAKKSRYIVGWGLKGLIEEGALRDKKVFLRAKSGEEIEVYLGARYIRDASKNMVGLVCLGKDLREVSKLVADLERSKDEIKRHRDGLEKLIKELTENRDVMLSILEDTDESKRRLEDAFSRLKEMQGELLQAEKMASLGQLAAGVAHEINNPLFVISGESEMMEMDESLPESAKESVRIVRQQVVRIGDVVRRLLEFSRKKEVVYSRMDVNELLVKSMQLLQYQVKASGRVVIVNNLSTEPLFVDGDQNQLQEVFVNIMLNAAQAMDEKGGTLTLSSFSEIMQAGDVREESKLKSGQKAAVMVFKDTGPGMSEEIVKHMFEPFFTTKKSGTGLGMAVCFGIIKNHGGQIEVKSELGRGATIIIRLPLV